MRSLATRLNVALPAAADLTEGARAQWVTGLALMACSLTARAVAWLALATSDVEWAAAVNELNDGRFSPEWMTARRSERAASVEQERLRRAAGNGFSAALTPIEVIRHVSGAARAAVVDGTATGDEHKALVTRVARATAQTHAYSLIAADDVMFELAAGTAVLKAMKANNHGLDKLTQAPADAALALQHVLIYVTNALDKAAAAPAAAAGAGAAPFAPTDSAALGESWKQSLVTALGRIAPAAEDAAAKAKTDPIVLGKAPEERGARRPEYFAPVDIEPFYAAEAASSARSLLHGPALVPPVLRCRGRASPRRAVLAVVARRRGSRPSGARRRAPAASRRRRRRRRALVLLRRCVCHAPAALRVASCCVVRALT